MKQEPLLVMWPGGAFPGVPFPLEGGKKKKTRRQRRGRSGKKTRTSRNRK